MRRTLILIAAILFVLASCPAWCWGPQVHTIIAEHAIDMLPPEIKPFYEANRRYIVAFSMLPDDWRVTKRDTGPEHYCDLDMLDEPPFDRVRGKREEVEARFGKEAVLEMGILPWVIEERFDKLVDALKSGDDVEAVVQSALLAHYIGDAHVPFHATRHWDGCKPEHKGLHFRWETNLLALHLRPESIKASSPAQVGDILSAAFDWLTESQSFVQAICEAEDSAREADPTHAYRYYEIMRTRTLDTAVRRITTSAETLAGVYVAGWERAGKPKMGDKPALIYWGR